MNADFFSALEALEKEKGISKEYMIEKIEAALASALKKEYGADSDMEVVYHPEKNDFKVYRKKLIVETVENPAVEISLAEAKAKSRRNVLGGYVKFEENPKNYRRLSIAAAKSVIVQGIREQERKMMQDAYESKREEIISATVDKIDYEKEVVILNTDNGRAVLRKEDMIPGESFAVGDVIKVFVQEVNREAKGRIVTLSRVHPGLVRRMFELEVPEITEGIVVVKGCSREAGSRSKIAVMSRDPDVDPVGACIGEHSMRIDHILQELHGEKINIIKYSEVPEEYIAAALAPATVNSVEMTGERSCKVTVDPGQLSLAIGKEGQNVRLAARLTGFKIDIKAE